MNYYFFFFDHIDQEELFIILCVDKIDKYIRSFAIYLTIATCMRARGPGNTMQCRLLG